MKLIKHTDAYVDVRTGNIKEMIYDQESKQSVRDLWLSEYGLDDGDVMKDAQGREYVYQEGEDNMETIYLPDELQGDFIPF